MSQTQNLGLTTYDVLGADKIKKLYDFLSSLAGITPDSNMNKIDKAYGLQKSEIELLKQVESIKSVDVTLSSSSATLDFYTASSDIKAYKDKMLALFVFSANNKQKAQVNINNLGIVNLKKYNTNGVLVELEANDIKKNVIYLYQMNLSSGGDKNLILVGEDINGQFKTISAQIEIAKSTLKSDIALKADKATTYTKTEMDTNLALKSDKTTTYTKTQVDNITTLKADKTTTYTKTEMDTTLKSKEPLIPTKNTAFNKNFGTASGTVCEGNDVRLSD
ncbi:MAG: hypothetical protein RR839_06515, partial [Oscillospiraceae bacterium]